MGLFVLVDLLGPAQLCRLEGLLQAPRIMTIGIPELDICMTLRVSGVFWRLKINLCVIREGSV